MRTYLPLIAVCLLASTSWAGAAPARTTKKRAAVRHSHRAAPASRHPARMARASEPSAGAGGLCHAAQAPRRSADPEKLCLEIPDLREQGETRKLTDALSGLKGVSATVVDLNTRLAVVDYDPKVTGLDKFVAACRDAGFAASEYQVEKRFPKPIKLKGG